MKSNFVLFLLSGLFCVLKASSDDGFERDQSDREKSDKSEDEWLLGEHKENPPTRIHPSQLRTQIASSSNLEGWGSEEEVSEAAASSVEAILGDSDQESRTEHEEEDEGEMLELGELMSEAEVFHPANPYLYLSEEGPRFVPPTATSSQQAAEYEELRRELEDLAHVPGAPSSVVIRRENQMSLPSSPLFFRGARQDQIHRSSPEPTTASIHNSSSASSHAVPESGSVPSSSVIHVSSEEESGEAHSPIEPNIMPTPYIDPSDFEPVNLGFTHAHQSLQNTSEEDDGEFDDRTRNRLIFEKIRQRLDESMIKSKL